MNLLALFIWHLWFCLQASAVDSKSNAQSQQQQPETAPTYMPAVDNGTYGYYPTNSFESDEVTSPRTNWLQWSPECDDGRYYFITPRGWSLERPGPMILDSRGELVWFKHFDNSFGGQAYDFQVQQYKGQEYLTFWLGDDRVRGHGSGFYYMLNSSYDIVHKVGAAGGLSADLHEFLITPEGTALMTMYQVYPHDVSGFREFDPENNEEDKEPNYIWDCLFQEVDIETGNLVFEWRASEHYNITHTYRDIYTGGTKTDPWDWFHINSVHKDELGNYLISARYTHSITYIDGKTGETIWVLGGEGNRFMDVSDGFGLNFAWQHDARFIPLDSFPETYTAPKKRPGFATRLMTMFDNAAEDQHYEYGLEYSRGLLLELTYPTSETGEAPVRDYTKHNSDLSKKDYNTEKVERINGTNSDYTVRVVKEYINPKHVRSSSQGSLQILPQPNGQDPKVFVGFGLNAVFTEFNANGTVLCDTHFGADVSWERGDIQSYRAYKFHWSGWPSTNPSIEISDDDVEAFVSWNGATEVVEWLLQQSNDDEEDDDSKWRDLVRVKKDGFETAIPLPEENMEGKRFLRALAIGSHGRVLQNGRSDIIDRGYLAAYFPLISSNLPVEVTQASPLNIFLIIVCNIGLLFVLYEVYRRYLSRKFGRAGAVPLRWRKGVAYRFIAEA